MGQNTYYEIFDIPLDATPGELKAAYRRITTKVHPDAGGSPALFRQVQEAYETLSDPTRRASYDRSLVDRPYGHGEDGEDGDDGPGSSDPPKPPPPWGSDEGPWSSDPSDAGPSGEPSSPYSQPPPYRPGGSPARRSSGYAGISPFFDRHPSATVAIAGAGLVFLGSATAGLGGGGIVRMGWISLVLGLLGLAGSRRARCRENPVHTDISARSAGRRFASEVFAGIWVVLGVVGAVVIVVAGRRGKNTLRRTTRPRRR